MIAKFIYLRRLDTKGSTILVEEKTSSFWRESTRKQTHETREIVAHYLLLHFSYIYTFIYIYTSPTCALRNDLLFICRVIKPTMKKKKKVTGSRKDRKRTTFQFVVMMYELQQFQKKQRERGEPHKKRIIVIIITILSCESSENRFCSHRFNLQFTASLQLRIFHK